VIISRKKLLDANAFGLTGLVVLPFTFMAYRSLVVVHAVQNAAGAGRRLRVAQHLDAVAQRDLKLDAKAAVRHEIERRSHHGRNLGAAAQRHVAGDVVALRILQGNHVGRVVVVVRVLALRNLQLAVLGVFALGNGATENVLHHGAERRLVGLASVRAHLARILLNLRLRLGQEIGVVQTVLNASVDELFPVVKHGHRLGVGSVLLQRTGQLGRGRCHPRKLAQCARLQVVPLELGREKACGQTTTLSVFRVDVKLAVLGLDGLEFERAHRRVNDLLRNATAAGSAGRIHNHIRRKRVRDAVLVLGHTIRTHGEYHTEHGTVVDRRSLLHLCVLTPKCLHITHGARVAVATKCAALWCHCVLTILQLEWNRRALVKVVTRLDLLLLRRLGLVVPLRLGTGSRRRTTNVSVVHLVQARLIQLPKTCEKIVTLRLKFGRTTVLQQRGHDVRRGRRLRELGTVVVAALRNVRVTRRARRRHQLVAVAGLVLEIVKRFLLTSRLAQALVLDKLHFALSAKVQHGEFG